MGVRPRARGDKEPVGRTKVAILLFLADKGESSFTWVRVYLRERYNIRGQMNVRRHLDDLSDDRKLGLLEKKSNGKGNACSYRIRDGFESMCRLYDYLNSEGAGPELMRTGCFAEFIAAPDFFLMIKIVVIRRVMLDLYRCINSDEGTDALERCMRNAPRDRREAMLAWMERVRRRDLSDPIAREFVEAVEAKVSADQAYMAARAKCVNERGIAALGPDGFYELTAGVVVWDEYRDRIGAILRFSPSAFDCIMNLTCDNPLLPRNPFLVYAILLLRHGTAGYEPAITLQDCVECTRSLPWNSSGPPLYLIARSCFVYDMANGKLAVDEVPEDAVRLILCDG